MDVRGAGNGAGANRPAERDRPADEHGLKTPSLQANVQGIGEQTGRARAIEHIFPTSFQVVDFGRQSCPLALPGGHVYINRGFV